MRLFDVRHQARAHRIIQRALACDRLPHAYIFHGPEGVGKEMLATRLARILLCRRPQEIAAKGVPELAGCGQTFRDACGRCRDCHLVEVGTHPDLHLIYRQLNAHHAEQRVRNLKALEISVDVIRQFVIDAVGITPACGAAKVFIIREADRISTSAQNAMLKTLEEPPPATFLILVAEAPDVLLNTTRSRCQSVGFVPLPSDFVAQRLQEMAGGITPEDARLYAALAHGSLGTARRYAVDDLASAYGTLSGMLDGLNRSSAGEVAVWIMQFAKDRSDRFRKTAPDLSETAAKREALRDLFVLLANWYGGGLRCAAGAGEVTSSRVAAGPATASATITLNGAARAISLIAAAEGQVDLNANVQLCIGALMFKLACLR